MRLFCVRCEKSVSSDLPDTAILRAACICPECIETGVIEITLSALLTEKAPGLTESPANAEAVTERPVNPQNPACSICEHEASRHGPGGCKARRCGCMRTELLVYKVTLHEVMNKTRRSE